MKQIYFHLFLIVIYFSQCLRGFCYQIIFIPCINETKYTIFASVTLRKRKHIWNEVKKGDSFVFGVGTYPVYRNAMSQVHRAKLRIKTITGDVKDYKVQIKGNKTIITRVL